MNNRNHSIWLLY